MATLIRRSSVCHDQLRFLAGAITFQRDLSTLQRRPQECQRYLLQPPALHNFASGLLAESIQSRQKHTKRAEVQEEDSEEEELLNDDQNSKIVTGHMGSLRADGVIKSGLGLARNKVESLFYESRIRVNGAKITKKSQKVYVGDEVDVIRGFSEMNGEFLVVSRVVVLSCKENEESDGLVVKLRRFKNMTVENYSEDPWDKKESSN